ncbi:MAG TPA: hypothetical protein VFN97_25935 [Actinospica sp.]|nr:hypothetical protein [Actinospica sp.]
MDEKRRTFREQGYVVVPGVLDDARIARGRALIEQEMAALTEPLHEFREP